MVIGPARRLGFSVLTHATLGLSSVYCLFPFLWMVDSALQPTEDIRSVTPTVAIVSLTMDHVKDVLLRSAFMIYFRNSLTVGLASTIITTIVSIFCG